MTARQFRTLVVLTVIAGFLGGAASDLLFRGVPVLAQEALDSQAVVKARSFQVVDDQGKVQAQFGMLPGKDVGGSDGSFVPSLALYDADSRPRSVFYLAADGSPDLVLLDSTGEPRVSLGLAADGSPGLALLDSTGELRAGLAVLDDYGPSLALLDSAGEPRVSLGLVADGNPGLTLRDSAGKLRAGLAVLDDYGPSLTLLDSAGKLLWSTP